MLRTATLTLLTAAATALAQPVITIDVEHPVLMPGQSTTVTMFAGFGGTDYAMAGLATDFFSSVGSQGFADAMILDPMDAPITIVTPGEATSRGIEGIIGQQLHFPTDILADPTNPIAFWTVTYTAPVDTTAPFDIDLMTMTMRYDVYIDRMSATSQSRLADLTEGAATIRVIPAPASALVLALGAVALRRRR